MEEQNLRQGRRKNKNFFEGGFDLRALIAIVGIVVSIIVGYWYYMERKKSESSTLSMQVTIQPIPTGSQREVLYYESNYMFINEGKATIKVANVLWFLNNTYIEHNSLPIVLGSKHGVDIEVSETTTPGFCDISLKDLPPGLGFMVGVRHRIKKEYAKILFEIWHKHMFDKEFSSCFLSEVNVNGENVSLRNDSFLKLEGMMENE